MGENLLNSTVQFIGIIIVLFTLVTLLLLTQSARRRRGGLRAIAAYDVLPLQVGASIEADRPLHVSFGSAGIGGESTPLALASAEFFYQVAQRTATGETAPVFTMSSPTAVPLAQDTLRRAYLSRGRLARYTGGSIQWYPAGGQALAFAAALTGVTGNERIITHVLAGNFGSEMALVLDAAARRDVVSIATSGQLEGQAVAYAMSEYPLLGEEVFAAGAYLGDAPGQVAALTTVDLLRALLIVAILVMAANGLSGGMVFNTLGRLLSGGA